MSNDYDNQNLDAILAHFAASFRAQNRSDRTIESYSESARQLFAFVGHTDPTAVSTADIERYADWVRTTRSPQTARTRWVSLRALWSGFLIPRGYADASPFTGLRTPQADTKVIRVPTEEEVMRLLAATDYSDPLSLRDRLAIMLMADVGLRREEVVKARLADVNWQEATLTLRTTKTGRDRRVPLSPPVLAVARRWARARAKVVLQPDTGHLLLNRVGAGMTGFGIYQLTERAAARAGVSYPRLCHALRSFAVTKMLDNGMPESQANHVLGWRPGSRMLAHYQHGRQADRAISQFTAHSPLVNLGLERRR